MLGTITLTVGQTDAMPQKEDSPETIEVLQDEVSPQVNGEQEEDKSVDVEKSEAIEEKAAEEKPSESNEVGFKKIFRFVGFKFTLKKDKNEKTEPVQLLTVKETEEGASEAAAEESKEETVTEEVKPKDENAPDAPDTEKEATTKDAVEAEAAADLPATDAPAETVTDSNAEPEQQPAEETPENEAAEEVATTPEKEKDPEAQTESPTSPPSQEIQSPFKRFFTQGIFSNLRKKTSFKKSKDEEPVKEKSLEEDIKETEEKAEEAVAEDKEVKEDVEEGATGEKAEESAPSEESKVEASPEELPSNTEDEKEEEPKVQAEATVQTQPASETEPAQEAEPVAQAVACEVAETPVTDVNNEAKPTDDTKPADDKPSEAAEEQQSPEKSEAEATTEPEAVSSQEKSKAQGSPLKKLFTGAGLKKLSSKKQKGKKEAESKLTESGEQVVEQIQSSTESAEPQKPDSRPSSPEPEESGEHVVEEATQPEAKVEAEGEAVTSDSEKKKDGILPWASFKKLVTPKKRVKRPSESEDEAPGDKPKSATLSSTESAVLDDKTEETKPSDEVKEEAKEESQAESKAETKAEKLEQSTEEPKKKMDTSVSWEALICVGSAKKRARKTSDSDDDETKIEEEVQQAGEEQAKTAESPLGSSQEADHENLASSPEPEGELVSTWESFKRLVTHRKKPKTEDKSDEASGPEQTISDSEVPKEESSFSFKKLIPRRKKKSDAKQGPSSDVGSAEEDSDTPAVVPLSEYDNEQSEKVEMEKKEETKTEDATLEATPVTPAKASAEDRSPSWISAAVEKTEDEAEGKQLSDIPEEGDTAATPKSTDNTIAEDIVEFTSEAVTALEPAEETEMVSAVSRITASPVTSGETTPVPGDGVVKAEVILQEAVETISVTSSAMAVTVTEEQKKIIAVSTSPVQVESAIKEEKVVLLAHDKSEATALCTGLHTSEIKDVEEESPVKASVESVSAVSEALPVEVAVEDQTPKPEEAGVDKENISEAQVNEVQAVYKEQLQTPIENAVEDTAQVEAVKETSEAEIVNELQEATAVKVAVVTAVQQEAQILEEPLVAENSPKVETEGPIEPSVEEPVCAQTVEVTEIAVAEGEKVQELKDIKESVASVEVLSVESVAMAVSEEITPSLTDTPIAETVESKEDLIPVVAPTEKSAVTEEIVCVSPASASETEAELKEEAVIKEVATVELTADHNIQLTVKDVEVVTAKVEAEGHIEVSEKVQEEVEPLQAMDAKEAEAIQEQSTVIVQEVIQNVVENLGEMQKEQELSEKPVEEKEISTTASEEASKPEDVLTASEKTEEKPVVSVTAEEEKPSADSSVQEEKPADDLPVQEEKTSTETTSEKPLTSETENTAEEQQTRVITERSPVEVSEAIQISETVPVAITDEIKPEQEELATVSVDAVQKDTDVIKQEVEVREVEKNIEVAESTECEDGKCQVEEDLKEVPKGIQKVTTETPVSETPEETATLVTKQAQMIEEQCQVETTMEMNVGIINVVDADEGAIQDTDTSMKGDSSKNQVQLEDKSQTVLEESQKDISAQDMEETKEESEDATCQETDAKASEVKMAVEETVNAIKEEEVTEIPNETDPASPETATVS
ncbi:A-kinase anchor protein 12b isoform X2 [Colossoma macropomum]|uniref:A-kinase anchor protein 12b isoform X2 n=1 Tax=Colossoma macropomum TaxID=42526 RepID=UPI001863EA6C|nr:A-kinase anchor protein 12b isoform X2 [Colossoma macropomum]